MPKPWFFWRFAFLVVCATNAASAEDASTTTAVSFDATRNYTAADA